MKSKYSILILLITITLIALSMNAAFAADMNTTSSGTVSGGVDVASSNPWNTTGNVSYTIPTTAKNITSAQAIVNVYSGSAQPTYGALANVSLNTGNGYKTIATENLTSTQGSADGQVYVINNHTTKVYSDYEMTYNITDQVITLQPGDTFSLGVTTSNIDNLAFDGRIKAITVIIAYNDGDNDIINYWINSGQQWSNETTNTTFATSGITGDIDSATLTDISLSSGVAKYELNGNILSDPTTTTGSYYAKNIWNVTSDLNKGQNTILSYTGATSSYSGKVSFKNILSLLTVSQYGDYNISATFKPEYASGEGAVYAGVNNTFKVNITNGNNTVNYVDVQLFADGKLVATKTVAINNSQSKIVTITDPTIRDITVNTTEKVNNSNVNYTIVLLKDNQTLNTTNNSYPLLYNGYLGKNYEYPASNMTTTRVYDINGDVSIYNQNSSTYMAAGKTTRSDVWNINLTNSKIVEALIYVSYNWDKTTNNAYPVWNSTFNNVTVTPIAYYKYASNLGTYGTLGYGVIVYNATSLINSGDNTLVLNKISNLTAVYPSTLVLIYNTTGSKDIKTVYINEGADLLSTSYNTLPRETSSISTFNVAGMVNKATWYVFAANDVAGRAQLIFNNETFNNVFNGSSSSVGVYTADVTSAMGSINVAVFNATGSTILATQQILVVNKTANNFSTVLTINNFTDAYGAAQNLTGKLTDEFGNVLVGQHVALNLTNPRNGLSKVYWVTTDTNGEFQLQINLWIGTYTATASYSGATIKNVTYTASKDVTASVVVTNASDNRTSTVLTVNNYNGVYGHPNNLTGMLTYSNGTPIVGQHIALNLTRLSSGASKVYWVTTDSNGEFQQMIELGVGDYTTSATFSGTGSLKPSSSGIATMVVTKA